MAEENGRGSELAGGSLGGRTERREGLRGGCTPGLGAGRRGLRGGSC